MEKFIKPKMVRIQNSLSFDMVKIPNKKYEMGKYPVTIAEYMHFSKVNKEYLPEWKEEDAPNYYKQMNIADNAPIIGVSWYDAVAYCNWLNEQQKEYLYRLPTESEWEYVCRAGTTTKWSFGNDAKELDKYVWYDKNSKGSASEVGKKKPNRWKLFDMHGNVWEWCEDWYDEKEEDKILRGGSWNYNAFNSRSANRDWLNPSNRFNNRGFRLLRTLP